MKILRHILFFTGLATLLAIGCTPVQAQLLTKFGPVTGVLKGTAGNPQTVITVSSDIIGLWSGCNGTNFLRGDGTCATPAGTGVTSVAQTVPAGFAISGSPITSTGTLAISYATGQTANLFLATPNGSTGAISERAIVGADVPAINLATSGNGGVTGILLGTNGGTSNGFFSVTGPTTALRTFTFPNASATVLTDNALVTVVQGGTGANTLTGLIKGNGTAAFTAATSANVISLWTGTCSASTFLRGDGACASAGGGAVGGANTNVQFNNSGVFGGDSGFTYAGAGGSVTLSGAAPNSLFNATGAGSDQKNWRQIATSTDFIGDTRTDAGGAGRTWLDVTRGTGVAIGSITLGNSTDVPAVTAPGGFIAGPGARPTINVANSGVYSGGSPGGIAQISMVNSGGVANSRVWDTFISGTDMQFRLDNDAISAATVWMDITRSGTTITSASFGAATNAAATFIEGRRTIWGRWTISAGCATVAGSGTFGFSGAASSGAGNCTLNFNPAFNTAPICTATAENIGNPAISLSGPSTSAVVVSMLNAGVSTNGNFAISCTGT